VGKLGFLGTEVPQRSLGRSAGEGLLRVCEGLKIMHKCFVYTETFDIYWLQMHKTITTFPGEASAPLRCLRASIVHDDDDDGILR